MGMPKPMSGTEAVARLLVLEAFVIEIAKESPLSAGLRAKVMAKIESFNRPDLVTHGEIYVEEISKAIG